MHKVIGLVIDVTKLNKVGTGLGSDVLLLMVITRHWSVTLLRFLQYLDEAVHTGKQSLWQRLEFQGVSHCTGQGWEAVFQFKLTRFLLAMMVSVRKQ